MFKERNNLLYIQKSAESNFKNSKMSKIRSTNVNKASFENLPNDKIFNI